MDTVDKLNKALQLLIDCDIKESDQRTQDRAIVLIEKMIEGEEPAKREYSL